MKRLNLFIRRIQPLVLILLWGFSLIVAIDMLRNETFFINLGQGTSATHGMWDLMCKSHISTCHFHRCCPQKYRDVPEQVALIGSIIDSSKCLNGLKSCSAKQWMQKLETAVMGMKPLVTSSRLNGIMDNPTTGISRHLINMISPYKKIKFILTVREKNEWARRRQEEEHNGLYCNYNTSIITGRVSNPLADHIECVQVALQQNKGKSNIMMNDVFSSSRSMNRDELALSCEHYNTIYVYDIMNKYFQSIGEKLQLGLNYLHVDFFNKSINFQAMENEESFNNKVFEFLTS